MGLGTLSPFYRLSAYQSLVNFPRTHWRWAYTRVAGPGGNSWRNRAAASALPCSDGIWLLQWLCKTTGFWAQSQESQRLLLNAVRGLQAHGYSPWKNHPFVPRVEEHLIQMQRHSLHRKAFQLGKSSLCTICLHTPCSRGELEEMVFV